MRRYVTDAGPLLTRLHKLTRSDCTTRNRRKAARLAARLRRPRAADRAAAAEEELDASGPTSTATQIMELLGIPPGPVVGRA